ncbi:MAG: hypothetical protein C0397_15795 [Odoribacter sp.]|nr:hypothetical protein [Odoribacter sp.]
MKIICFILSLYVLSLSLAPCCSDDDNCCDEIKTEHTDNHSQDHNDSDCNTCSPFFTCGTCSGFVFTRSGFNFREVPFSKSKFVAVYKSQFANDFFVKIWQPPKIS